MNKVIVRAKNSYKKDVAQGLSVLGIIKKFFNKTISKESARIVDAAQFKIHLNAKVTIQYDLQLKISLGKNKNVGKAKYDNLISAYIL